MISIEQGFAASVPLVDAIQAATDNALRHHPGATVRFVKQVATRAHVERGEYVVQLEVDVTDADVRRVDLTDPEVVAARRREQATAALLGLNNPDFTQVMTDPAVAQRRTETGTGGGTT